MFLLQNGQLKTQLNLSGYAIEVFRSRECKLDLRQGLNLLVRTGVGVSGSVEVGRFFFKQSGYRLVLTLNFGVELESDKLTTADRYCFQYCSLQVSLQTALSWDRGVGVRWSCGVFFNNLKRGINGISTWYQRGITGNHGKSRGMSPEEDPGLGIGGIKHLQ